MLRGRPRAEQTRQGVHPARHPGLDFGLGQTKVPRGLLVSQPAPVDQPERGGVALIDDSQCRSDFVSPPTRIEPANPLRARTGLTLERRRRRLRRPLSSHVISRQSGRLPDDRMRSKPHARPTDQTRLFSQPLRQLPVRKVFETSVQIAMPRASTISRLSLEFGHLGFLQAGAALPARPIVSAGRRGRIHPLVTHSAYTPT